MMPIQRIRSAAHRRILLLLSQGPRTVSEIAHEFDMRMPHASLACRQLRASGDIYRDDAAGIRKAPLYLSQSGLKRLEEDALAKSKLHVQTIPPGMNGIILQIDGSEILIGYTETPKSPLLFVQDASISSSTLSKGNRGGAWILCRHQQLVWYDLETLTPSEPPSPSVIGTLDEFNEKPGKIGLVRGAIVERTDSSMLLEGQWFASRPDIPEPTLFNHGQTILGMVEGHHVGYSPPFGSHADLSSSLDRTLVLNAMGHDCLKLSELNNGKSTILPLGVLHFWLQLRHPRMSPEKITERYDEITDALRIDMNSLPLPMKRELLADFGDAEWTEIDLGQDNLDLYGMSSFGLKALCEYILNHSSQPFVIEWPFSHPDVPLLERILSHPMCRMVVTRNLEGQFLSKASVSIRGSSQLAQLCVHLNRSNTLPIMLDTTLERASFNQRLEVFPQDGLELLDAFATGNLNVDFFSRAIGDLDEQDAMSRALHAYPIGDELLANELEPNWPVASWISSPSDKRTDRWTRLQHLLPKGWVNIHSAFEFDLHTLAHSLHKGNGKWVEKAFSRLALELRSSPEILLRISTAVDQAHGSWLAAAVLAGASSLGEEFDELMERNLSFWLSQPHLPEYVLPLLFPVNKHVSVSRHSLLEQCLRASADLPEKSFLGLWARSVQTIRKREPWGAEQVRSVMESFPHLWWAPYASEWLLLQLNTSSGRTWLRHKSISWPSLVVRMKGEIGGLPGIQIEHPGFSLSSDDLIATKLLQEGNGTSSLDDLYEMTYALEQQLPPPSLKTHPQAAWLVQPIDSWPTFSPSVIDEGDPMIGLLLYSRSFAARQRLTMD